MSIRPEGKGLGDCPRLRYPQARSTAKQCACDAPRCAVCGNRKHVALHMHCYGEKPGDPPYGHEYKPAT